MPAVFGAATWRQANRTRCMDVEAQNISPIPSEPDSAPPEATIEAERRHWKIEVSYDGTDFLGWQKQPHGITVQEVLEQKLSWLYANEPIRVEGAGRTDAGVHAVGMAASFAAPLRPLISGEKLFRALNRMLPTTVSIRSVTEAPPGFNARFDAKGKAYTYVINRSETPAVFARRWSWHLPDCRDLDAIRRAAAAFVGEKNFSSFAVEINKSGKDPMRRIDRIDVQEFGELACVTFVGKSFLYKMIRSLIGTLGPVGQGRLPAEAAATILARQDRTKAPDTAPALGLSLMKVFYNEDEWRGFKLEKPPFHY